MNAKEPKEGTRLLAEASTQLRRRDLFLAAAANLLARKDMNNVALLPGQASPK